VTEVAAFPKDFPSSPATLLLRAGWVSLNAVIAIQTQLSRSTAFGFLKCSSFSKAQFNCAGTKPIYI
jgi:hypothetical protein